MDIIGNVGGMDAMFNSGPSFFNLFSTLVIVMAVGGILFVVVTGLNQWTANNNAELLTRKCLVVDKRTRVSGGSGEFSASTHYYITFEFIDASRIELHVSAKHYGLIAAGDRGELMYQGTRFKQFIRDVN